ncbi:MAG: peptide chain release factor-like protein [bacterium]|nr:peptide chain release factor-like protein [bacterium]
MQELGILEKDLKEQFVAGSGRGGQKLNKTASAVLLKHIPTGAVVKCQKARERALNRFFARRRLCEEIEAVIKGQSSNKKQRAAKIRKQKKRRRKRAESIELDNGNV